MASKLIQVTDCHLTAPLGTLFRGRDPAVFLSRCLNQAAARHPEVKALLLTGDLVHDAPTAYPHLAQLVQNASTAFAQPALPVLAIAGNHDVPAELASTLSTTPGVLAEPVLTLGNWCVIGVNTQRVGSTEGYIDAAELNHLSQRLAATSAAHILLALHHPPIVIGSAWMDEIRLQNTPALSACIRGYPIRGMVFGHIHQAFAAVVDNVTYLGTPSSVLQFKAGAPEFALDTELGGAYRVIHLTDTGQIHSQVEWVDPT